jgi:hypothetical protein
VTRRSPSVRKVLGYASTCLLLDTFFRRPGDGRVRPQIAAKDLIWSQIAGQLLRCTSFHGVERLLHCGAATSLGVGKRFSEDSLAYFNERLQPNGPRAALAATAKRAKRNKAFRDSGSVGLAIDGTGAGRCGAKTKVCELCRPYCDATGQVMGHKHEIVMVAVVGTGLTLPLDVEPYAQGDAELTAGIRLMERVAAALGPRFADYVVADAKYAAAPFLNQLARLRLHALVRLKDNVPALHGRASVRFNTRPPDQLATHDDVAVELWDDDSFEPWEGLEWPRVRVLRYRYRSRNGELVDACWLTDYPKEAISSAALFRLAKSRWEIENEGFNDAKTRHGMEHICRHNANALLVGWLLLLLAMVIERLYRLCHLHRGVRPRISAADLLAQMLIDLGRPRIHDTS